ncbi:putative anti-restriction nuclease [Serratia phage vB_SmaM_Haymo]|nr:putative anti-restriction nuclease [Serratia phage vB_SmaM_Haymo]
MKEQVGLEFPTVEEALQYSIDFGKRAMENKEKENLDKGLCKLAHLPEVCIQRVEYEGYSGVHQRRIVSAANRFYPDNGEVIVIASARHYDPLMVEHVERYRELGLDLGHAYGENQGFIDQFRNYWTREEAWVIALHAGQIRNRVSSEGELFSENLY